MSLWAVTLLLISIFLSLGLSPTFYTLSKDHSLRIKIPNKALTFFSEIRRDTVWLQYIIFTFIKLRDYAILIRYNVIHIAKKLWRFFTISVVLCPILSTNKTLSCNGMCTVKKEMLRVDGNSVTWYWEKYCNDSGNLIGRKRDKLRILIWL